MNGFSISQIRNQDTALSRKINVSSFDFLLVERNEVKVPFGGGQDYIRHLSGCIAL
jgi:hypothetical protein